MELFQDIIFIWIRTCREIFKSALVYLQTELRKYMYVYKGISYLGINIKFFYIISSLHVSFLEKTYSLVGVSVFKGLRY